MLTRTPSARLSCAAPSCLPPAPPRSRYRLSPKAELDVVVRAGAEKEAIEKLESLRSTIEPLANTASLVMGTDVEKPAASIAVVDSGVEVFVVLEGKVDLSAEKAHLADDQRLRRSSPAARRRWPMRALWLRPRPRWSRRRGTVQLSSRRSWRR